MVSNLSYSSKINFSSQAFKNPVPAALVLSSFVLLLSHLGDCIALTFLFCSATSWEFLRCLPRPLPFPGILPFKVGTPFITWASPESLTITITNKRAVSQRSTNHIKYKASWVLGDLEKCFAFPIWKIIAETFFCVQTLSHGQPRYLI